MHDDLYAHVPEKVPDCELLKTQHVRVGGQKGTMSSCQEGTQNLGGKGFLDKNQSTVLEPGAGAARNVVGSNAKNKKLPAHKFSNGSIATNKSFNPPPCGEHITDNQYSNSEHENLSMLNTLTWHEYCKCPGNQYGLPVAEPNRFHENYCGFEFLEEDCEKLHKMMVIEIFEFGIFRNFKLIIIPMNENVMEHDAFPYSQYDLNVNSEPISVIMIRKVPFFELQAEIGKLDNTPISLTSLLDRLTDGENISFSGAFTLEENIEDMIYWNKRTFPEFLGIIQELRK
jgi:hypothetical protein